MRPKILTWCFLVLSLAGVGLGYVLYESYKFGICVENDISCHFLYSRIGAGFLDGMGALAIVFLALLFIQKAFSAWWKFAIWFIPLAALLFIFYPEPGGMDLALPYPETIFQWVSGLYLGVSAVIIATAAAKKG